MRRGFWAMAATIGIIVLAANTPIPLFTVYQSMWHFSTGMLTVIYGVYTVGVLAAVFFIAPLSDVLGRRAVLLPAIACMAAGLAICAMAPNVAILIVGRVLQGLAIGAATTTAMAALGELKEPGSSVNVALVATVSTVVGLAGGPLIAGLLAEVGSNPLLLPYATSLVLTALAFAGVASAPETVQRSSLAGVKLRTISVPAAVRPAFWLATFVELTAYAVAGTFAGLGGSFTRDLLNLPNHAAAGLLVALLFAASTAAQLIFRAWPYRRAMLTGLATLAAGLVALVAAISAQSAWLFFASTVVLGGGHGLAYAGSQELLDSVAPPEARAQIIAGFLVGLYAGATVPAIAVGFAAHAFGFARSTTAFAFVVIVMTFVGMTWIGRFFSPHTTLKGTVR